MLRNLDWLHDLDVQYDASTFDTDPFEPQPDGMDTIFPFWVPAPSPLPLAQQTVPLAHQMGEGLGVRAVSGSGEGLGVRADGSGEGRAEVSSELETRNAERGTRQPLSIIHH